MGIGESFIVAGFILIIIDIFLDSDYLSLVALLLFSIAGGLLFTLPVLYKILLILVLMMIFTTLYLLGWRRLKRTIIDRYIAPDRYTNGPEGLIGQSGVIKNIDGTLFVKVYDEIWGISEKSPQLTEGESVTVDALDSNDLILSRRL